MSGAPLINMRETKFNNNSRFKTLSDEDLFADEAEPLNSILSKFKYWPRNGNKMYTKRSMLLGGFLLFCFGFLLSFFIFSKLNFSFHYDTLSNKKGFVSFEDVLSLSRNSQYSHPTDNMNRVLSFPQSHSCDDPSEVVSKRFCFSCIFSVSFLSLIFGYLLGSRKPSVPIIKNENFGCEFYEESLPIESYIDFLQNLNANFSKEFNIPTNKTYTNYEGALVLKKHFQIHQFDYVSPVISSEISLSFKNKNTPDALEIIVDVGEIRYRNVRNTTYRYSLPDDARSIHNVTNNVSGLPVYGNFGSEDDFHFLKQKRISLDGCIVLLRLGKVTAAFKRGANGVLLFADPQQYPNVDLFSVSEEISPTVLADLQRTYGSLESQKSNPKEGIAIQIIEAMTAQNILREMAVLNKSPDSWRGSLDALYSIGPGFIYDRWRLVMYSYFLNVRYTSHDVAAYLKGSQENDRYIIVGSKRKTLKSDEKTVESVNAMIEVSRIFAELKLTRKWKPLRTIIFCSFGLEESQIHSVDSWLQMYKHLILERTAAYLEIKQPIRGLELFYVQTSPLLRNIFENVSTLVENPNTEEKQNEKKTLFNVLDQQKSLLDYRHPIVESKVYNTSVKPKNNLKTDSTLITVGDELFASLGVATLSFGYANKEEKRSPNDSTESIVNIYEYESAIVQLWTLLTFTLATNVVLPFNISGYSTILNNFHEKMLLPYKNPLQNYTIIGEFNEFETLVEKLSTKIQNYQDTMKIPDDKKPLKIRVLNDKLMQIDRLMMCFEEYHKFPIYIKNEYPVFLSLQEYLMETNSFTLDTDRMSFLIKKSINCVNEIDFIMNEITYGYNFF